MTETKAERLGLETKAIFAVALDDASVAPMQREIEQSIAISLKRIADALERIGSGDGLNSLHGFVTDLAYQAGMNFQGGMRRGAG